MHHVSNGTEVVSCCIYSGAPVMPGTPEGLVERVGRGIWWGEGDPIPPCVCQRHHSDKRGKPKIATRDEHTQDEPTELVGC
jgi:hypothetical protein